ncbi:MAG: hypothetical protein O3A84_09090 [Proteobacteria bacterium]|nr:hypothetical protein [Pseudomonadota bacterium]
MRSEYELSYRKYGPLEGWRPEKIVVLLPGPEVPAEQMMKLAHLFAPHFPTVKFSIPEAPYSVSDHPDRKVWLRAREHISASQVEAVKSVSPVLNTYLDRMLEENGLTDSKMALVGFSEGAVVALHVGLRRAKPVSGILCFAGCLLDRESLKDEILSRPEVYLIQGDADPYLPNKVVLDTVETLMRSGVRVGSHFVRGEGHQIGKENLKYGSQFLAKIFRMQHDPTRHRDHKIRHGLNRLVASVHQSLSQLHNADD